MYPVSDLYKEKINEDGREFTCNITIEHSQGTLELTDDDLSMGSLTYTEATQSGDEYTIGSTVASDISFTIFNKPEYDDIQFMGATVFVSIGLLVQEGIEHFLQPSQPSRMRGFDDKWEYVPLGRFNIDVVNINSNTIQIKAIDNMINFDKPYSLSNLSYPATLQQIYVNVCNVADVPVGTLEFPNKNYIVTNRPSGDLTLRDILGYVAELSGTFAKCTRTGSVELRWYEPTDLELRPEDRYDFTPSDDVIQITGILATVKGEEEEDDVTYISGSEGYTIDLTENELLQGDYETVLPNIYNNVKDTIFTPYISNSKGNPAIQAGDIIKQIDKNGKEYTTIITKAVYKYRGKSTLEGKGLSQISKGYKGSTNRRLAEIKHKIDVEIGDKLTTLEEQQLQAIEMMANMLGGHIIKNEESGIIYIADNPDILSATKIWKWGIDGFGYSSDGGITWETAITADGSIVAMLVSAGIVTADMVQTGILQSEDGELWINLNNGHFQLGDMRYNDDGFELHLGNKPLGQVIDDIIGSIQVGGGNNFILNSVGYGGLNNWNVIEGEVDFGTSTWILSGVSKHGWKIIDGIMEQEIDVVAGKPYSISGRVNKGVAGTIVIKIVSNLEEYEVFRKDSGETFENEFSFQFDNLEGNITISIEVSGATTPIEITDLMLAMGENIGSWSQANGEVYTVNVKMDNQGIRVYSADGLSSTIMSPEEFAGYYNNEKIFTLNGNITEVMGLRVGGQGLFIPPVKFVQTDNSLDIVWTGR